MAFPFRFDDASRSAPSEPSMAGRLLWGCAGLFFLLLAALGALLPFWPAPPFAVLAALALTAAWPALRTPLLRWPFFVTLFRRWDHTAEAPLPLRLRTALLLAADAMVQAFGAVARQLRRWRRGQR